MPWSTALRPGARAKDRTHFPPVYGYYRSRIDSSLKNGTMGITDLETTRMADQALPNYISSRSSLRGLNKPVIPVWQMCRALVLTIFTMLLLSALALAQETNTVTRKNIDNLTPEELAAFEHALQILKDRSKANPYDKAGYLWQAWIHNCPSTWVPTDGKPDGREQCDFWQGMSSPPPGNRQYERVYPGMCEHGKDLFLPWHRAQLYFFEEILQATDPDGTTGPSTKNVALPYWNWTRPPSGNRYPQAMENQQSPLYHANRKIDPISPGEDPYTSPLLIGHMLYFFDWPSFGGYEKSQQGGYGRFERSSHNPMHSRPDCCINRGTLL